MYEQFCAENKTFHIIRSRYFVPLAVVSSTATMYKTGFIYLVIEVYLLNIYLTIGNALQNRKFPKTYVYFLSINVEILKMKNLNIYVIVIINGEGWFKIAFN
jgi:hypothetical protein